LSTCGPQVERLTARRLLVDQVQETVFHAYGYAIVPIQSSFSMPKALRIEREDER
jgi:hypothetical protein